MNRGTEIALALIAIIFIGFALYYWYATTPQASTTPLGGAQQHTQIGTRSGYLNDGGTYYTAKAAYPAETALEGSFNDDAVDIMKAFVQNQMTSFKLQNNLDALTAEDIKIQGLDQDRKYALDITFETYSSPTTVSYVFLIYENTLGAHPNGYYRTFTWDKETGKELSIGKVIKTSDYLQKLSSLSRAALLKKLGEDANTEMLASGTTPSEDNFKNFAVSGNTLQVIFAPYQVGPYAIGTQIVTIPLAQLTATSTPIQ